MLPPNLTRHFWETRRAFMQSGGVTLTPWFQLTPAERVVAESEVEMFRMGIRAAEEEQDLITSLPTPPTAATPPAEEPEATTEPTELGSARTDSSDGEVATRFNGQVFDLRRRA